MKDAGKYGSSCRPSNYRPGRERVSVREAGGSGVVPLADKLFSISQSVRLSEVGHHNTLFHKMTSRVITSWLITDMRYQIDFF